MIEALIVTLALATSVKFERAYTNRAWGYVNHQCVIDETGMVWFEDRDHKRTPVRQVSETDHRLAVSLVADAMDDGLFGTQRVAADLGDLSWMVHSGDETVVLKVRGNLWGGPLSDAATDIANLIDKWCEGEPGYPAHLNERP